MRVLVLIASMCVWVVACSGDEPAPAGAGASGGSGGAGSGGAAGSSTGGAGGEAGVVAGTSGGAMASGGVGGSGGSGGSGGMDAMASGGTGATPALDAGDDASVREPLAARVCPPAGTAFGDPLPPEGQRTAVIVPGIQAGFVFLEGPLWLADQGVLLFTDMDFGASGSFGPPARIRKLTPPSTYSVFAETGNSNGLALDVSGDVLACSHDLQTLSHFDPVTASRSPLSMLTFEGKRFNSPNDLTVRSDGTIYFTDPDWQLGPRESETGDTNVYRVTPAGEVSLITSELEDPNGIALSPDERTLYVGSTSSTILKFQVNEDGSLGASSTFVDTGGGSDGFAIDCAGNLYTTGGTTVQVWDPSGQRLGAIDVLDGPSNAAFGGPERKTLFITAGNALYSIELNVPGLPY